MKELSTEEKAKRFDEILSMAKECITHTPDDGVNKYMLNMFPELKESEDGLVRKTLVRFHKSTVDIDGIKGEDIVAWLEKQGEKLTVPKWKYKNDNTPLLRDSLILNKYGCVTQSPSGALVSDVWVIDYDELAKLPKEEFEKQDEQKPADKEEPRDYNSIDPCFGIVGKVEPKFKIGDWITDNNSTFQIVRVENEWYHADDGDKICFDVAHQYYHLWTINDAKPGDILATKSGRPFIFKDFSDTKHPNNPTAYCGINTLDNFIIDSGKYWWVDGEVYPATKEQSDLLFQKMKESGYKWENNQLEEINNKGVVDLGLPSGTLWATCNLGAEKETDFGLFYQWGDTKGYNPDEGHDFNWNDYKWGASSNLTKYNSTDGKLVLDNEDDPVFVATNGKFKLPTKEQLQELIDCTIHEWISIDGVNGMKFTNKNDETKYIFIPAAGDCYGGSRYGVGSWGDVWSASRNESNTYSAWSMYFDAGDVYMRSSYRCNGCSVRGVLNK